ncbi:methylenetetrahydrofolate reductase [Vulcanisaeta thermophila]|uniref:methylenetetrahydrofolate reductase n=1 Tax=Vulcanisaeta thermophila TaxID=867917 RepID=UPI000852E5B6|nr:methylenetetrahydrofolate reductase [Vulcanisaeta thermophila]
MAVIIAELPPLRNLDNVDNYLNTVAQVADYVTHVNIPDSTFANPSANSILTGALIRRRFNVEVIANVRVADHNKVGLMALIMGGIANGVRNYLLLRGDLGPGVTPVQDLTPTTAIGYLRSEGRLKARFGISISTYTQEYIRERLEAKPDFAMLQYTLNNEDLELALRVNENYGIDLYPPLLIITNKSAKTISKILNKDVPIPNDPIEDAVKRAKELLRKFPGIYLTAPGDLNAIINTAKALKEII